MRITRTESFARDFAKLPAEVQERVVKALRLLVADPRHPSLQVKKMQPKILGIFEGRVSQGYRMTFTVAREEIVLRRVGTHDILRTP